MEVPEVPSETVISPVEYIKWLPAPSVVKVHLAQEIVPSPLSVAKVAHDPPVEDTVTSVALFSHHMLHEGLFLIEKKLK